MEGWNGKSNRRVKVTGKRFFIDSGDNAFNYYLRYRVKMKFLPIYIWKIVSSNRDYESKSIDRVIKTLGSRRLSNKSHNIRSRRHDKETKLNLKQFNKGN